MASGMLRQLSCIFKQAAEVSNQRFVFSKYRASLSLSLDPSILSDLIFTDPNQILRELEAKQLSLVAVCLEDLKHSVVVQHVPFLCRLTATKLVGLSSGSSQDLSTLMHQKNVFIVGFRKGIAEKIAAVTMWISQFQSINPIDLDKYPELKINRIEKPRRKGPSKRPAGSSN